MRSNKEREKEAKQSAQSLKCTTCGAAVDELAEQKVPRTRAGRYRDAFYRFSHGPLVVSIPSRWRWKEAEVISRRKNSRRGNYGIHIYGRSLEMPAGREERRTGSSVELFSVASIGVHRRDGQRRIPIEINGRIRICNHLRFA